MVDPRELELPESLDYTFTDWIISTADLQITAYGYDPADGVVHTGGEDVMTDRGKEFFRWNVLATIAEMVELLDEAGWKPWATSQHINRDQVIGEAVDALHFIGNLLRMVECNGQELTTRYRAKQMKNLLRQVEGYDGVKTKCPKCHRDLAEVPGTSLHQHLHRTGPSPTDVEIVIFCSQTCSDDCERASHL